MRHTDLSPVGLALGFLVGLFLRFTWRFILIALLAWAVWVTHFNVAAIFFAVAGTWCLLRPRR